MADDNKEKEQEKPTAAQRGMNVLETADTVQGGSEAITKWANWLWWFLSTFLAATGAKILNLIGQAPPVVIFELTVIGGLLILVFLPVAARWLSKKKQLEHKYYRMSIAMAQAVLPAIIAFAILLPTIEARLQFPGYLVYWDVFIVCYAGGLLSFEIAIYFHERLIQMITLTAQSQAASSNIHRLILESVNERISFLLQHLPKEPNKVTGDDLVACMKRMLEDGYKPRQPE